MKPLKSVGIADVGDAYVHSGFLFAYNVVADKVLSIVKSQLAEYPGYSVVVTGEVHSYTLSTQTSHDYSGHSLGGSVGSLAALSIRAAHPSVPIKLYTYGKLHRVLPVYQ